MNAISSLDLRGAREPALPANIEAEQALIGCVLYDNDALHRIEGIEERDFYEPFHGRVWAALAERIAAGRMADPITLADRFAADPALADFGASYLMDLYDRAPPSGSAPGYGASVKALSLRRDLIRLSQDMAVAARDQEDPTPIIHDAGQALSALELGVGGDNWTDAGEAVREAIAHAQARHGRIDFPFGIPAIDRFSGGLNAGEMTIIGARPGMGKTVAGLTIAVANASAGLGVCVFSLEMTKAALGMRLACDQAYDRRAPIFSGVQTCPTFEKAMKGELDDSQWRRLADAQDVLARWPLRIDDRSGLTIAQIEAAARRQHREWRRRGIEPGPVVIDHLGKVRPPHDRRGAKNAEVADVSNEAQGMAKRLGVPVVALVQLNRAVESRDDKLPQLSDLRQAGELEEDARQVIFLFRPEYYAREDKPGEGFEERAARLEKLDECRNQLFWLVEKNSHGPRGQVKSFCEIACSAIREW